MDRIKIRRRWLRTGAAAIGLLSVSACDVKKELLSPQNPGTIDPSAVNSPTAADGLRVGALGRLKNVTAGGETVWLYGGLLTDEWKSSDTFSQRNETDQRSIQTSNSQIQSGYNSLQQSRGFTRTAITALQQYTPLATGNIATMYFTLAFEEMTLAENFCNGIPMTYTVNGVPNYGPPLTNAAVFDIALTHYDSALALATGTDSVSVTARRSALIGKARTLVNEGKFAQAAALVPVSTIPTNFANLLTFTQTSGDNQIWSLNISAGRYTVSDSADATGVVKNALPFVSAKDPRVPTIPSPAGATKPFDGTTPLILQQIWKNRNDPVPLVSGIDARLIEAEASLNAKDYTTMMATLNALRTTSQTIGAYSVATMTALPTPATDTGAVSLFFREAAFWTWGRGQRLPNERRMVRQYGRSQDQVFPTGPWYKGDIYKVDVNLPVTDSELTNPNFTGCIDRKA